MRRLVLVAALSGVGLLVPAVASAAVKQIYVNVPSSSYCISVDNGPTAANFTIRAPGGGVLETRHVTSATAGQNCTGSATPGQESFFASFQAAPGATITADAGAGVAASFPVPYGAYDAAGTTGIVKVANLPSAAGTVAINGGVATGYTGPAYTSPAVSVGSGAVDVTSTVGSVAYRAIFTAVRFSIYTSYYGNVTVYGADPLGSPIAVSEASGGAVQQSTSIATAVDHNQRDQARLPLYIPSGAVVTATQPGWFSHVLTQGTISSSPGAVNVAVPAVGGETASAYFNLQFQATSGLTPSDPLDCTSFGDATYMLSNCGTAAARYAASFPVFFGPADYAQVTVYEADGDTGSVQTQGSGLATYLSDGSMSVYGLAPNALLTLTATTPSQAVASMSGPTYGDGSGYVGGEGGTGYIPLKIVSGTSLVATGSATGGVARTFLANLVVQLSGTTISGTTYPSARVSIENYRPSGSPPAVYGMADGNGAFSFDVGALLPRDQVTVRAADPSGTSYTQQTIYPGQSQPAIQGVTDQQLVRGTVALGALGSGPSGVFWGGDGANALSTAAPFAYSLDTTTLTDGPHRISATSSGYDNTQGDYLYVRVDNTPPAVATAGDQYVGVGYGATLLVNAHDANGLGSVVATFGDGTSATQPKALLGQAVQHAYAKAGTYKASVTVTDAAGNTTTGSATIHVVGTLATQVSGKIPATFKQTKKRKKRNLAVTFTAHMAGKLSVRVIDSRSKVRAASTLTFAAANKKARLTVKTKTWKKGRYTVVLQFTDANGTPGPVVLQALRIT